MPTSRYNKSEGTVITDLRYKQKFNSRWLPSGISVLENPDLHYPTDIEKQDLTIASIRWKLGDRLYKLAHTYYGNSSYWWIIAFYNKKPTEQSIEIGDLIQVPTSLTDILSIYGV